MIALVSGEVAVRRPDHVVLVCGGVGYKLAVSAETLRHVPAAGNVSTLHAHMVVREDAIQLYGFHTEEERDLFLLLLGVQNVGPKMALAVLSGGPPRELLGALAAGDHKRFQAVPGIGKRTAERIIVELREKVAGALPAPVAAAAGGADGPGVIAVEPAPDDNRALARDGLLSLGFTAPEIDKLLADAPEDSPPEALIQFALREARR